MTAKRIDTIENITDQTETGYSALSMPTLRALAKTRGLTVTSGVRKPDLVKILTDTAPAPVPSAPPVKASPVRKDVTASDVTPETAPKPAQAAKPEFSPADVKRIETLESIAGRMLKAAVTDSTKLANTLATLYPFAPWKLRKQTIGAYFAAMGITPSNYIMPTDARRRLATLIWRGTDATDDIPAAAPVAPSAPVSDVASMTGATTRTIARDRDALGLANENRQTAQRAARATDDTDGDETATASGPVTRMVPVLSLTSVREFIHGLIADKNADALEELWELIEEGMSALSA